MPAPLPRDPSGKIILPGAHTRRWSVDFSDGSPLPSWLTVSVTGNGSVAVSNGALVFSGNASTAPFVAYVTGPSVSPTAIVSAKFDVVGLVEDSNYDRRQIFQGISTFNAMVNNTGQGVMLHTRASDYTTGLRHTTGGDWPIVAGLITDLDAAYRRGSVRINRSLALVPGTVAAAYALSGDGTDVMLARDMPNIVAGSVSPVFGVKCDQPRAAPGTASYSITGMTFQVRYP